MNKVLLVVIVLFSLMFSTVIALAERQTMTPRAGGGDIYLVIGFKYNSRNAATPNTNVSVQWGKFSRSSSYAPPRLSTKGTAGVVIRLKHTKNDAIPLTVETDGRIVNIAEGSAPFEWSSPLYQQANW